MTIANLFILAAGLAGLCFALLLALFLVALANLLVIEPYKKRKDKRAERANPRRFRAPAPRLHKRSR